MRLPMRVFQDRQARGLLAGREPKQPPVFTAKALRSCDTGVYFFRCLARPFAHVEQRGLYRRVRDIGSPISFVSSAAANARAGHPRGTNCTATNVIFEHGKWQGADAKTPSLGLYA